MDSCSKTHEEAYLFLIINREVVGLGGSSADSVLT